jgi:hypothetical protein
VALDEAASFDVDQPVSMRRQRLARALDAHQRRKTPGLLA